MDSNFEVTRREKNLSPYPNPDSIRIEERKVNQKQQQKNQGVNDTLMGDTSFNIQFRELVEPEIKIEAKMKIVKSSHLFKRASESQNHIQQLQPTMHQKFQSSHDLLGKQRGIVKSKSKQHSSYKIKEEQNLHRILSHFASLGSTNMPNRIISGSIQMQRQDQIMRNAPIHIEVKGNRYLTRKVASKKDKDVDLQFESFHFKDQEDQIARSPFQVDKLYHNQQQVSVTNLIRSNQMGITNPDDLESVNTLSIIGQSPEKMIKGTNSNIDVNVNRRQLRLQKQKQNQKGQAILNQYILRGSHQSMDSDIWKVKRKFNLEQTAATNSQQVTLSVVAVNNNNNIAKNKSQVQKKDSTEKVKQEHHDTDPYLTSQKSQLHISSAPLTRENFNKSRPKTSEKMMHLRHKSHQVAFINKRSKSSVGNQQNVVESSSAFEHSTKIQSSQFQDNYIISQEKLVIKQSGFKDSDAAQQSRSITTNNKYGNHYNHSDLKTQPEITSAIFNNKHPENQMDDLDTEISHKQGQRRSIDKKKQGIMGHKKSSTQVKIVKLLEKKLNLSPKQLERQQSKGGQIGKQHSDQTSNNSYFVNTQVKILGEDEKITFIPSEKVTIEDDQHHHKRQTSSKLSPESIREELKNDYRRKIESRNVIFLNQSPKIKTPINFNNKSSKQSGHNNSNNAIQESSPTLLRSKTPQTQSFQIVSASHRSLGPSMTQRQQYTSHQLKTTFTQFPDNSHDLPEVKEAKTIQPRQQSSSTQHDKNTKKHHGKPQMKKKPTSKHVTVHHKKDDLQARKQPARQEEQRSNLSQLAGKLNQNLEQSIQFISKQDDFDAIFDPKNYENLRHFKQLIKQYGDSDTNFKDLKTDLKQILFEVNTMLSDESFKHVQLFSQKDSLNTFYLYSSSSSNMAFKSVTSSEIMVDVVSDETPTFCKVYVGDRQKPILKFTISEVSHNNTLNLKNEKSLKEIPTILEATEVEKKEIIREFKTQQLAQKMVSNLNTLIAGKVIDTAYINFVRKKFNEKSRPGSAIQKSNQTQPLFGNEQKTRISGIQGQINKIKKSGSLIFKSGFHFRVGDISAIKDLNIYVSELTQFPSSEHNQKQFFNKHEFEYQTVTHGAEDINHRDINIPSKYEYNKFDPYDMKVVEQQNKGETKAKSLSVLKMQEEAKIEDYVYVAFSSKQGCKIKVKVKISGDYTQEFIEKQKEIKQKEFNMKAPGPVLVTKQLDLKFKTNTEYSKKLFSRHRLKSDITKQIELDNHFLTRWYDMQMAFQQRHLTLQDFIQQNKAGFLHLEEKKDQLIRKSFKHQIKHRLVQQRKQELEDQRTRELAKSLIKWDIYKQDRETIRDIYFGLVYNQRRIICFTIFMKLRKIFKRHKQNIYDTLNAKILLFVQKRSIMIMVKHYKQVYLNTYFSGLSLEERNRQRLRQCLTMYSQLQTNVTMSNITGMKSLQNMRAGHLLINFLKRKLVRFELRIHIMQHKAIRHIKSVLQWYHIECLFKQRMIQNMMKKELEFLIMFYTVSKVKNKGKQKRAAFANLSDEWVEMCAQNYFKLQLKQYQVGSYKQQIQVLQERWAIIQTLIDIWYFRSDLDEKQIAAAEQNLIEQLKASGLTGLQIYEISINRFTLKETAQKYLTLISQLEERKSKLQEQIDIKKGTLFNPVNFLSTDKTFTTSQKWHHFKIQKENKKPDLKAFLENQQKIQQRASKFNKRKAIMMESMGNISSGAMTNEALGLHSLVQSEIADDRKSIGSDVSSCESHRQFYDKDGIIAKPIKYFFKKPGKDYLNIFATKNEMHIMLARAAFNVAGENIEMD